MSLVWILRGVCIGMAVSMEHYLEERISPFFTLFHPTTPLTTHKVKACLNIQVNLQRFMTKWRIKLFLITLNVSLLPHTGWLIGIRLNSNNRSEGLSIIN